MFPLAFVASCYLIEKVFAMRRTKWFLGLCAAALAGSLSFSGSVLAQTQVIPDDVLNPKADSNIPELLQGIKSKIRLEDIGIVDQLRFDSLLDPSNGVGSTRSAAAQSIIHNHQLAQQQVQLAITFLQANRNDIIRGRNKAFNDVFGKVGTLKRVAVLAPVSLPGQFNLVSPTLLRDSGAQGGNNNTPTIGSVGTQLRSGDSLFLIDPADPQNQNITTNNNTTNTFTPRAVPNQQNVGYVVKVAGVILPQTGGANGGGQNNNNRTSNIILDSTGSGVPNGTNLSNLTAYRIVRFEDQPDPSVYEQVLATYMAIRDALAGFDPLTSRASQSRKDITYRRRFLDINSEYATGDATSTFGALNSLVDAVIPGRGADRLVRQAGFSKSDSLSHIDALYDLAHGYPNQSAAYGSRPTTPLLWSADNDVPISPLDYAPINGKTDEDRAFFHDQQTIFGGLDNPFDQYLGASFLREYTLHANDNFFENSVSAGSVDGSLGTVTRFARQPAGDPNILSTGGNNGTTPVQLEEVVTAPDSGTPIRTNTLAKWQMLIESFAEHNSDLDSTKLNTQIKNVAAVGLVSMVGGRGAASSEVRASDAGSYASFANLDGVGDFDRVEPIGKRGSGGFNPVIVVK